MMTLSSPRMDYRLLPEYGWYRYSNLPRKLSQTVRRLTFIQKVLGSNHSRTTLSYIPCGFPKSLHPYVRIVYGTRPRQLLSTSFPFHYTLTSCHSASYGRSYWQRYPCSRQWIAIGLWDVEVPTFSRQSAQRWQLGCQSYAPAALYPQEDSWYSFLLEAESTPGHCEVGRVRSIKKSNDFIGNRTRYLPACSIVPQTNMPWATDSIFKLIINKINAPT
jgi:hypothetical protein